MKLRHGELVAEQWQGSSRTMTDLAEDLSKEIGKPLTRAVLARFKMNDWRAGTPRPKAPAVSDVELRDKVDSLERRVEALEGILRGAVAKK